MGSIPDEKLRSMKCVITGGSGFIGTNAAKYLSRVGHSVVVIDDLSRVGSHENSQMLFEECGLETVIIDITNRRELERQLMSLGELDAIIHLAGQVSMMKSIADPVRDFEINAVGTLNILEWARLYSPETLIVATSSNKIYGDLRQVRIIEESHRYVAPDFPKGFDESLALDFQSPYGCSKGAMDQYLLDYGRIYGLRTVSLRQSAVYGPHQHPRSDQGWLAFMIASALANETIHLNGIGKQVRDVLHVEDLSRLFDQMISGDNDFGRGGLAFNCGGGNDNAISILELFDLIEEDFGLGINFKPGSFRPSDQKVFVSNCERLESSLGWRPKITYRQGVGSMIEEMSMR